MNSIAHNPYSPPQSAIEEPTESPLAGYVARNGDDLWIFNGADLPPRCFVTGKPTVCAEDVQQFWQPRWVYALLFCLVLPYLIVSPMVCRSVTIRVPLAERICHRHYLACKVGIGLVVAAGLLFISGFLIPMWYPAYTSSLIPGVSFLFGVLGCMLANRQAYHMQISRLDQHVLILRNVHPDVLNEVPPIEELPSAVIPWIR